MDTPPKPSNGSGDEAVTGLGDSSVASASDEMLGRRDADRAVQATKSPNVQSTENNADSSAGGPAGQSSGAMKSVGTVSAREAVRQPRPPTRLIELIRVTSKKIVRAKLDFDGENLDLSELSTQPATELSVPMPLYDSLLLPREPKKFESTRQLFENVQALLQEYGMLPARQSRLVTYWVFASWFPDFLPFFPALVITGSAVAADLLLGALARVCRRPVLLAGLTPASLREITSGGLMPTLLIRAPQLSKPVAALLEASNQPGYFATSGKDVWQFYCAKCAYLGEEGNQFALGARSVHIHTGNRAHPVGRSLPPREVVEELQNQLLYYRWSAHDRVAASKFTATGFLPELCAVAQVLGAAIDGDPELQQGIVDLLKERDGQARVDRSTTVQAVVLRAVLWYCHQSEQQQVLVREVTETANGIYKEEGESAKLSNESVGHVLKNLGLYTRRLGSAGRGLVLDTSTQAQAHELAHARELLTHLAESPVCDYCKKLQVQTSYERF